MNFQFSALWMTLMLGTGCSERMGKVLEETVVTQPEAGEGLREALTNGVIKGISKVSKQDGYFRNVRIKIPFPQDAIKIANALRDVGLEKEVEKAVLSMNRAAEGAAVEARPIFLSAINKLTFQDAIAIVKGNQDEATRFLQRATYAQLVDAFSPKINHSLKKVNATKYWKSVIRLYNNIPFTEEMNPNLVDYVTRRAIDGLFVMIAKEEKLIRQDPLARVSDLLKRVFALQD